ncbi:MAG TPA: hypothetical protein VK978_03480 [Candidatus Saccharimonadales bacterium]|nr:hypothetical protein [Candidatus Saccharimonadales bacterium]
MSVTASFLPPMAAAAGHVRYGCARAKEAIHNLRLTNRDQSKAAAAIIDQAATAGPIEYAGPTRFIPPSGTAGPRIDQVVALRLGGHRHQLRVTRPLSSTDTSKEVYLAFPGITLDPSLSGTAGILHEKIAESDPGATTASINTNGVGAYESSLSLWQILHLSFPSMAAQRLDIAQKLFHDKRIHAIGYSMGGAILGHTAFANLEKPKADIVDLSFIKPVLVTPENAKRVLGFEFLPRSMRAQSQKLGGGLVALAKACVDELAHLPAPCYGNALQLAHGINQEQLITITGQYPSGIQVGEHDPLNQRPLNRTLMECNPHLVQVREYAGRDHDITDHADEVVTDMRHFTRFGRFPVAYSLQAA